MENREQIYLKDLIANDLTKGTYTSDEIEWRRNLMLKIMKGIKWVQD